LNLHPFDDGEGRLSPDVFKNGGIEMKGNAGLIVLAAAVIILAALVMVQNGILNLPAGASAGLKLPTPETTVASQECKGGETPSWVPGAYNALAPASALTESTNIYQKIGDPTWTTFTQGTAITAHAVGSGYRFVYGINTSDFIDNAYGPVITEASMPCRGDSKVALYADCVTGSLTSTFYNTNHDTTYENSAAGVSGSVFVKYTTAANLVYGNPYLKADTDTQNLQDGGQHRKEFPNKFCAMLNSTTADTPDAVKATYFKDGQKLTAVMNRVSQPVTLTAVSGHVAYCYEAPVVDENGIEVELVYNSDDTYPPKDDETVTLFAGGYYIDENAVLRWGVVTDNGGYVGSADAETTTVDFTA
jgi:hypothetical protein